MLSEFFLFPDPADYGIQCKHPLAGGFYDSQPGPRQA